MIQFVLLVLESCLKHLRFLCGIGTIVHRKELEPVGQHKCPRQEFDIGKSQVLLLFPIILKFLPHLKNNNSMLIVTHHPGLLKLIKAIHLGLPY